MVLKVTVRYLDMIRESVNCIAEEVEKISPSGQKNGLNLNLLEKEDYTSCLILQIRERINKYIENTGDFSPNNYTEINMKISELLENLERELEIKVKKLKNPGERPKNFEKVLEERDLGHYKNIFLL